MNEEISQFYVNDDKGTSQGVPKVNNSGMVELRASQILSRLSQRSIHPQSSTYIDGIPGIPFESGVTNPDVFFQGEDIIYDMFIFFNGAPVVKEDYEILAAIKTSPRASRGWTGSIAEGGIYQTAEKLGYYELWIPAAVTQTFLAGTYYINVAIREKFAAGKGRFDRKYTVLKTYFNIDYGNFSENVENRGNDKRSNVEPTWPNSPNTIGTRRNIQDNYYIDPT